MEQITPMDGRRDGRLARLGIAAIALSAWVAWTPALPTAWADTPVSGSTSVTDTGPSVDTDSSTPAADKPQPDTEQPDPDEVTKNDAPPSAEDEDEDEQSAPVDTGDPADPDLDVEVTEPATPEPTTTPVPTAEPTQPAPVDIIADEPATQEPQRHNLSPSGPNIESPDTEHPNTEHPNTEHEELGAAVATLPPATTLLTLDAPAPAPARIGTLATALTTVDAPTPVVSTPTPPQPLSPIAELLEVPGRLVNAVLQVLGFTTAANVPVSPITFAPINDAIFGTFREIERQLGLWQTPAPQPVVPTMTYEGDTTRPTPTVAQFLNASAAGYVLGSTPGGLVPFTVDGFQMSSTNVLSGMVGKAWVTPEGQVIIAYQGTTGGSNLLFNPLITISQIVADLQVVFTGTTPLAFYDALDFADEVRAEAAAQGYEDDDIFVTGHSLGGWEAQFVAQKRGLAGIGFEAPGMNTTVPGNGAESMFVNIGTYGSSAPFMSTDLPGLQPFMPAYVPGGGSKPHYGPIILIGDPAAMTPLYNAATLWGRGPIGSAIFLVDFLGNFFQYHLPGVQAYHLGVTPDPGIVLWLGTSRGPVLTGYGDMTIPELLKSASDDGILIRP